MVNDNIRLRIELNSIIKFYIKIHEKSTLSDLKKLVVNILNKNYGISLPSFSLRTIDGFEILEIFRLGDILDDNQILTIDAFTHSNKARVYSSEKVYERQSPVLENNSDKFSDRISGKDKMMDYEKLSSIRSEILSSKKEESLPVEEPQLHPRIEIPVQEPIVSEVKSEKRVIGKSIQKPEDFKSESTIPMPPRPENFKGFVVKRSDLTKKQTVPIDDSCFKPLKKRKVEIEEIEL